MNEQEHAAYWRGYNDAKNAIQLGQLRVWFGLTNEEIKNACNQHTNWFAIALDLEAKLKEKNGC